MKNVLVLGKMGMNIVSDRATWGEVGGAHLFLHSPSYLPRKLDGITVHNSGNMEIAIATNTPFILTVGRLKESRFRDVLAAGWFDGVVKGIPRLSKVTFCGHLVEDNRLWSGRVPVFSLSGIFLREFLDCSSLFGHIGAPTGVLEALGVTVRE
jgi:hypothetical protein